MKEAVLVYDDKTKEGLLKEAEKIAAKQGTESGSLVLPG